MLLTTRFSGLICKGGRQSRAQALTTNPQDICKTSRSATAWAALLDFAQSILAHPSRSGRRRNMTKIIKDWTTRWLEDAPHAGVEEPSQTEAEAGGAGPMGRQKASGGEGVARRGKCEA